MKIIKHYWRILTNRHIENFKDIKFEGRNIYNMKDFSKEMTWIHRTIKKMFIVPAIMFFDWYFKDKLINGIDDSYQFRKLKVFDEAFDNAVTKWNYLYRPYAYGLKKSDPKKLMVDGATKRLNLIKDFYVTINSGDTAYLEFHNFLMDEIVKNMSKVDKDHVLYTSQSICDNKYFIITDSIKNGSISLKKVE